MNENPDSGPLINAGWDHHAFTAIGQHKNRFIDALQYLSKCRYGGDRDILIHAYIKGVSTQGPYIALCDSGPGTALLHPATPVALAETIWTWLETVTPGHAEEECDGSTAKGWLVRSSPSIGLFAVITPVWVYYHK